MTHGSPLESSFPHTLLSPLCFRSSMPTYRQKRDWTGWTECLFPLNGFIRASDIFNRRLVTRGKKKWGLSTFNRIFSSPPKKNPGWLYKLGGKSDMKIFFFFFFTLFVTFTQCLPFVPSTLPSPRLCVNLLSAWTPLVVMLPKPR